MFLKTTLAAAAIATAVATLPVTTAGATGIYLDFGSGWGYSPFPYPQPFPQPQAYSCWQAKNALQAQFAQVWTVECNGSTYTFNVKDWGPIKTVKFNKFNGNFWYV